MTADFLFLVTDQKMKNEKWNELDINLKIVVTFRFDTKTMWNQQIQLMEHLFSFIKIPKLYHSFAKYSNIWTKIWWIDI